MEKGASVNTLQPQLTEPGQVGTSQEKACGQRTSSSQSAHCTCKINARLEPHELGVKGIIPLSVGYRFLGGQSLVLASSI